MDLLTFRQLFDQLAHGKKLPDARYIFRPNDGEAPPSLLNLIRRAELAARPAFEWNLLKIHADKVALTFLSYPGFDDDPHPALAEATQINLNSGSIVRTDFRNRANPPILHRKEAFLHPDDSRIETFSELTAQEVALGLYRNPTRIGFRLFWESELKRLGVGYEKHRLVRATAESGGSNPIGEADPGAVVARHRTAIRRYDLSKPVKQVLERGLLRKIDTFFDYGCGHGMDVEALQSLGYQAAGWDPAFRPTAPKLISDVVNLGYVLNVIEVPEERVVALRAAFGLCKRLLVVSTMVTGQETESHSRPYRDGFLTRTNTFQKFYAPGELEAFIEDALDAEASTLGLGLCVVFRDEADAETFELSRSRRRMDWAEISTQLKFSTPSTRERSSVDRYDLHRELFDAFWGALLDLGRTPEPGEFVRLEEIKKAAGGIGRAVQLTVGRNSEQLWQLSRKARAEDVLVYLALARFRKRFLRREIPLRIKNDIRAFYGDLTEAQKRAQELLFAAGDPGEISLACEDVLVGWQDADALTIHRDLLSGLPAVLRIYVHCAAFRYGDPTQADLIKIHKHSRKVTFQHYDDFDGKSLPELRTRIKVNLRNLFVEVFDHSVGPNIQLLFFKERFVSTTHPYRAAMEKFSGRLKKLGLDQQSRGLGPDKATFQGMLTAAGLNERLKPLRNRIASSARGVQQGGGKDSD